MNETIHAIFHACEIVALAVMIGVTMRHADILNSITIWAKGVDMYLSGDTDDDPVDEESEPLDDPCVKRLN